MLIFTSREEIVYHPLHPQRRVSPWVEIKHYFNEKLYSWVPALRPTLVQSSNPEVIALTSMFNDLKAAIRKKNRAFGINPIISIPDGCHGIRRYREPDRFRLAAQQARLRVTTILSASQTALTFHGVQDCFVRLDEEPLPYCVDEDRRKDTVLVVSFGEFSLESSLITRDVVNFMELDRWRTYLELGAKDNLRLDDPKRYWEDVRKAIVETIGKQVVGQVILIGDHTADFELRTILKDVLAAEGTVESLESLLESEAPESGNSVFDAARGGAIVNRIGMENMYTSSPESNCEIAPEHDEV